MKTIKVFLFSSLLLAFLVSCSKDYLDTTSPTALSPSVITADPDGIVKVVDGVHVRFFTSYSGSQLVGNGLFGRLVLLDLLSDDSVNPYPLAGTYVYTYRWQHVRTEEGYTTSLMWNYFYKTIQQIHSAFEMVYTKPELKPYEKDAVAELYIFRAFSYFMLVQMYGKAYQKDGDNSGLGVPLRLENSDQPEPRATVAEVYEQILKDLEIGLAMKQEAWDAEEVDRGSISRLRLDAAYGIAARVHLTMQDWAKAAEYAQKAIEIATESGTTLMDPQTLKDYHFFEGPSSEHMWGYNPTNLQAPGYAGFGWIMGANAQQGNITLRAPISMNRALYDPIGENDVRRGWIITDFSDFDALPKDLNPDYLAGDYETKELKPDIQANRDALLVKFKVKDPYDSYAFHGLMRLPEMYYILAEAKYRTNEEAAAQEALNTVMQTRDPDFQAPSGTELLDKIINNKRLEFYMEGMAFFEQKRLNRPVVKGRMEAPNFQYMSAAKVRRGHAVRHDGGNAIHVPHESTDTDPRWQFKIPLGEIEGTNRTLMIQNP